MMTGARRALAVGFILGISCAVVAQNAPPAQAPVLAGSKEGKSRRKTLLTAIGDWQNLLPADPGDPQTAKYQPTLHQIKDDATNIKADQPIDRLEKNFEDWKQGFLSDLYKANQDRFFSDPQRFQDYMQQRLDALAAIHDGKRRAPAQTKQFDSLKAQINGIPDADALHRIYDKLTKGGGAKSDSPVRAVAFSGPRPDSDTGVASTKPAFQSPDAISPPTSPSAQPASSWKDLFDLDRAKRLAQTVYRRAVGFTHRCYEYVANAMEASGLFTPASSDATARKRFASYWPPVGGDSAYQFAALKNHPDVMRKTGLTTLNPRTRPLPVGTVIVYGRGCMGFSAKHGHIEVVTKAASQARPVSFYACSDGCTWRTDAWMDTAVERECVDMFIPVRAPPAPNGAL
jgi:hypothetical protein